MRSGGKLEGLAELDFLGKTAIISSNYSNAKTGTSRRKVTQQGRKPLTESFPEQISPKTTRERRPEIISDSKATRLAPLQAQ